VEGLDLPDQDGGKSKLRNPVVICDTEVQAWKPDITLLGMKLVGQGGGANGLDAVEGVSGQVARQEVRLWGADGGPALESQNPLLTKNRPAGK
jgi:hypothetical protein